MAARASCGAHIARGWDGRELKKVDVGSEERWNSWREARVGHEGEGAVLEHGWSQGRDERKGLRMQIAEHGVRTPAPDEANNVRVDAAAEHGHSTACTKAPPGDVGRAEMQVGQGRSGGA